MKTSYSALNTFEICPKKYQYQEIERRSAPKRPEAVFGTAVHSALRFMYERGPLYPTVDEVIDHFARMWNEATEKIQWTRPDLKEKESKLYFEEGVRVIKNFAKKNHPWMQNVADMESFFSVTVTDPETDTEHNLRGVIDRIDKDPEKDEYEIIDYKTAKKMPPQERVDSDLQLGLYSLALSERWPHVKPEDIKTTLYFVRHNEAISSVGTHEKIEQAKNRVLTIIREIERRVERSEEFEPIPGPLCDYCGYRPICPMWRHEYKTEPETVEDKKAAEAITRYFEIKEQEEERKKELADLRQTILTYMDQKKIGRVFGGGGYITRSTTERVSFDDKKLELILKEFGLWEKLATPDTKKLKEMMHTLPPEVQKKIAEAQKVSHTTMLKQTKKKF